MERFSYSPLYFIGDFEGSVSRESKEDLESPLWSAMNKPNDGYIPDSLGWVYYKKGEFEKALEYLQKAIEIVPDDPIMLEHVGDAYLMLDDKTNALKFYKKSLENKEKDKEELEKKIRELSGNGS